MNNLVIMHDQQAVTTSLILAEAFGKQHKHVLETIKSKINSAENSAQYRKMFAESTYTDKSGKQNKMFYLNRDGFTFIAMGFTGRKADDFKLKYIEAFNRMEKQLKQQKFKLPQTFSEALIELANEVKKNEVLQPKADKYDRYLSSKGLITITEVAKEYGMSGRELNEFLHKKGVIYKRGDKWFVYQKYANDGLAGYEVYMPRENMEVRRTLKWTTKGVQFIRDLLDVEGIKPVLERPQQLEMQEQQPEYDGEWYTASSIVYYLGLSEEYIVEVGKIANKLHLKPMFTDCNQYCRKTLDDNGFPRWEYTRLGAGAIEKELYKLMR